MVKIVPIITADSTEPMVRIYASTWEELLAYLKRNGYIKLETTA